MTGRLLLAFLALLAVPAGAHAQDPLAPRSSPNVEFVRNIPMKHFPNGGRLVGRHFYVTTGADLTIFDVSSPESPVQVGQMYFGDGSAWQRIDGTYLTGYEEDVDTNGRILLRADSPLQVVDVSDPRAPKTIGQLPGVSQHTISCVLDCTWAYGSEGAIVDLRDPRNPLKAGNWLDRAPDGSFGHDVTEVAPGIVLTATDPILLLDAREDPADPQVVAQADAPGFVHGTHWPNRMADRFALAGGEAVGPGCDSAGGATLQTWDTRGWERSRTFTLVDEYRLSSGTLGDGRHVGSRYCAHWFDPHPRFRDGGPIAMAWYEHGTRFVQADRGGRLQEVGWFLRPDGWAWGAYWITDRIVYVADHHRGIDVLRFTGDIPAPEGGAPAPAPGAADAAPAPAAAPAATRPARLEDHLLMPRAGRCVGRRGLKLRVREPARVRRVAARIGRARPLEASGGALRRPLRLRRPRTRRFALKVTVTTAAGERLSARRVYRSCGFKS